VSGMRVLMVYRRDRYLRGGDHIPFLERDSPLSGSPNRTKIIANQHQNVRIENGTQYGDLPQYDRLQLHRQTSPE